MTEAVKTSLQDFIAEVKLSGMASANRFFVAIPTTSSNLTGIRGSIDQGSSTFRKVGLFCEQASLPGKNFLTTPARVFGEVREVPYEITYDPVNLSLYVDRDFEVKRFFDEWQNTIFSNTARFSGYYREYVRNVVIYVYDKADKNAYTITLFEAYPKVVSGMQLDNNSKDVAKIQVTLQYKYWRRGEASSNSFNEVNPATADPDNLFAEFGDAFGGGGFANFDLQNAFGTYFNSNDLFGVPNNFLDSFNTFQTTFNSFKSDPVGTFLSGGFGGFKL